jgi:excisionase family DNA binding protein
VIQRRESRRPPSQVEQLYTPGEACDLLRIKRSKLYQLLRSAEIAPSYLLGAKSRRIPASAIARYLEGRKI